LKTILYYSTLFNLLFNILRKFVGFVRFGIMTLLVL